MIVIAGMHRSGTSMIANLLHDLGVPFDAPEERYATDQWNAKGYFEQADVMDLNSRILTGLRRNGPKLESLLCTARYALMPSMQSRERAAKALAAELSALGAKYRGSAVKDPRFCLTLRFWEPHVQIEKVVVCLRDPAAVAASLKRRQRFPLALGLRFWAYHIEEILKQVEGRADVLYVDFDALASDGFGPELRQIRGFLGLDLTDAALEALYREVFDPGLRHFERKDSSGLPARVQRAWAMLQERHAESRQRYGT